MGPASHDRPAPRPAVPVGLDNAAIAADLRVDPPTVGKWRQRFLDRRLEGLADGPRPPRTVTDARVEEVVTRTLETKPADATHWSTRGMSEAAGLSQTAVSRIWRAFGLKPHLVANGRDVVGLDLPPPDRAVVLCVDEKSGAQALDLTQLDHRRFVVHFTPASASWLNQVERFFAEVAERRIRRGVFKSVEALETAIGFSLAAQNANPTPFKWTATADLILRTVEDVRKRSHNSGH